ncbi:hypothetical protein C7B81_13920 [Aphanothece cf. minutissima CCALA 015]|uniref:HTH hxlR-type domain-containing protein n=1 Tax=Aphanothece cf. minutissima CCALA 015 TaxID=2107695 RepID=A0ABX5F560_9CHRO|nr:hypothetical protein C7B81_13920 [Aphanothece cf. minutissima CCALA 015]
MPRDPPVTRATLPCSRVIVGRALRRGQEWASNLWPPALERKDLPAGALVPTTEADPIEATAFVRAALQVLEGKWTLPILWQLRQGPQRYGDLRRVIPEISDKLLTQRLRDLERDGLVEREVTPTRPPRVSYSFSDYGRTLIPVIQSLCAWGQQHGVRQGRRD